MLLQEQVTVVLLLEVDLVSWSLAIDECGGYENLRGLDHRSVIPYVHGRCCIVVYVALFKAELNLSHSVVCPTFYSSKP